MSCFACFIFVSTIVDYIFSICIIQYKICEQLHATDGLTMDVHWAKFGWKNELDMNRE
jgi:hypothetical protein